MSQQESTDWRAGGLVFCSSFYSSPKQPVILTLVIVFLVFVLGLNFFSAFYIFKNRLKFSIRQRAPLLEVLHIMCYSMQVTLPLIYEALVRLNIVDWGDPNISSVDDIPASRYVCKFLMAYFRLGLSYIIFFR